MLKQIFEGKFNYLLIGCERSIMRRILLNRFFTWLKSVCLCTFDNFHWYNKLDCGVRRFLDDYGADVFITSDSNKYGYDLVDYVWRNLLIVNKLIDHGEETVTKIYCIQDNDRKLIAPHHIYYWKIQYGNIHIKLTDYILGINPGNRLLKFISDSIDNCDNANILKILLLKDIIVCTDIFNLLLEIFVMVSI